jgi:hypothetical protein
MTKRLVMAMTAKCSDLFAAVLWKDSVVDGIPVGKEYTGYVPDFMPGNHWGDYVELDIDLKTGKILNWNTPSIKALRETFQTKMIEKEDLG